MSSDLTCPHCGFTVDEDKSDLWEYDEGSNDYDCPNCEKELVLEVAIRRDYTLSRVRCSDSDRDHNYGDWRRVDIDQNSLDRWKSEGGILSKLISNKGPYSWYMRECSDCDKTDHSIDYPYLAEVELNDIEPRHKD